MPGVCAAQRRSAFAVSLPKPLIPRQALEQPDRDVVMDTPTNSRYAGAGCFPPNMRSVTWWGAKQHKWCGRLADKYFVICHRGSKMEGLLL